MSSSIYNSRNFRYWKVDIEHKTVEKAPSSSKPSLHTAAKEGDVDVVKRLLDARVNPFTKNENEETPLLIALQEWHKIPPADSPILEKYAGIIKLLAAAQGQWKS